MSIENLGAPESILNKPMRPIRPIRPAKKNRVSLKYYENILKKILSSSWEHLENIWEHLENILEHPENIWEPIIISLVYFEQNCNNHTKIG